MEQKTKNLCYFIIMASFVYVFIGLTSVNLPNYYPVLHRWSIPKIEGAVSMGYYSRLFFTLLIAGFLTILHKIFHQKAEINEGELIGFTKASVIIGILFFIAEEWHKWGIEKMKFDSQELLNPEFWLFLIVIVIFLCSLFTLRKKRDEK